jgi:hypothetical protein
LSVYEPVFFSTSNGNSFTNKKKLEEFINHWLFSRAGKPRRNNWVLIAILLFYKNRNKSVVALDRIAIAVPVTLFFYQIRQFYEFGDLWKTYQWLGGVLFFKR